MERKRITRVKSLLRDRTIIGIDDDNPKRLILMLDDGTRVVIEPYLLYVDGMTTASVRVSQV